MLFFLLTVSQICTDGDPEPENLNPCYTGNHDCDTTAQCVPGEGQLFTCQCATGYIGDGRNCYGKRLYMFFLSSFFPNTRISCKFKFWCLTVCLKCWGSGVLWELPSTTPSLQSRICVTSTLRFEHEWGHHRRTLARPAVCHPMSQTQSGGNPGSFLGLMSLIFSLPLIQSHMTQRARHKQRRRCGTRVVTTSSAVCWTGHLGPVMFPWLKINEKSHLVPKKEERSLHKCVKYLCL